MHPQRSSSATTVDLVRRATSTDSYETISPFRSPRGKEVSRGRTTSRGYDVVEIKEEPAVVRKKKKKNFEALSLNFHVGNIVLSAPITANPSPLLLGPETVCPHGCAKKQEEAPKQPEAEQAAAAPRGYFGRVIDWFRQLTPLATGVWSGVVFLISRVGVGLRGEDLAWFLRPGIFHRG